MAYNFQGFSNLDTFVNDYKPQKNHNIFVVALSAEREGFEPPDSRHSVGINSFQD